MSDRLVQSIRGNECRFCPRCHQIVSQNVHEEVAHTSDDCLAYVCELVQKMLKK